MSAVDSSLPGLALGRYCKALAYARDDPIAALGYGEGQRHLWNNTPESLLALKAAVSAVTTSDPGGLAAAQTAVGGLLIPLIRGNTLVDRLNLRRVPLNVKVPAFSGDASARTVAEGMAKPLSRFSLETLTIVPRKVAATIVVTDELLRFSSPAAEAALGAELAKAVTARIDFVFADPNVGGSISNGATTITSTGGSIAQTTADHRSMLNAQAAGGSALTDSVFISSTKYAIWLSTMRTTDGAPAFPTVTAKGGTLAGLPLYTTGAMVATGSPSESALLLLDQQQVLFGDSGEAAVSIARSADVELSDTPSSPNTSRVSLFQTGLVGLQGERWCGWSRVGESSVVTLDDIQFA